MSTESYKHCLNLYLPYTPPYKGGERAPSPPAGEGWGEGEIVNKRAHTTGRLLTYL